MYFFRKRELIGFTFTFLLIIYFISRLYNILLLPIFTDESIYIYWAKYIAINHSHWFLSLTDGKPPLLIWGIASLLTIFPQDWYLLAGRLPSVISGCISLFGLYFLAKLLFRSRGIALISALLYIINPFTLFYDRMALFDSLLSAMLIWSVYFAIKTGINLKVKDAILWGIALGLAFLAKPTAIIFLFLTPVYMVTFSSVQKIKQNFKRILLLILVMFGVSELINNAQRLSSVYGQMAIKNQQFQQPLTELLANPFQLIGGNTHAFFSWIISYYTFPVFVLGIFSFIYLFRFDFKKAIFLFSLWLLPIFIFATVGREIFPRYILFTTPYFLISIAYLIKAILSRKEIVYKVFGAVLLCAFFYPSTIFSSTIITNPQLAPLPETDLNQYITQHPSGYGLKSVFAFFHRESQKEKITIITQGTFGLYPYAFNLEFWNDPNVTILGRWPLNKIDKDIGQIQKISKVYIILKEYDEIPENLPLQLVFKSVKPGNRYPILVTELKD
jgi:4-amino-4-deoxy-L-arabinose transferase-like glycosyltransferase